MAKIMKTIKSIIYDPFHRIYKAPRDVNFLRFVTLTYAVYLLGQSYYCIENGPIIWFIKSDGEFVSSNVNMSKKAINDPIAIMQIGYDLGYAQVIRVLSIFLIFSGLLSYSFFAVPIIILKVIEIVISIPEVFFNAIPIADRFCCCKAIYFVGWNTIVLLIESALIYLTLRFYEEVKRLRYEE